MLDGFDRSSRSWLVSSLQAHWILWFFDFMNAISSIGSHKKYFRFFKNLPRIEGRNAVEWTTNCQAYQSTCCEAQTSQETRLSKTTRLFVIWIKDSSTKRGVDTEES